MPTPEQEQDIRSIGRRCAGPLLLPETVQERYFGRLASGESTSGILGDYLLAAAIEGYPVADIPMDGLTPEEAAQRVLLASLRKRKGCGADFNEVILAGPLDGEQHPYRCPQCGNEGVYIPPIFDA